MKKTRSDVVISVGPNNGRNDAPRPRPSLLDRDDADATDEEPKKSVAFGSDVVDADVDGADDPTAQPDCCDLMCPTNYIESVLCRADEALCVCSITDNIEAMTGMQLCADDDDEDIAGADGDEAEEETVRGQVKAVDNSLAKPDSSSNTTCDETVSDADAASVGNADDVSRSSSVVDESSGIALQKDISVLEESPAPAPASAAAAAAAADSLEELIETEQKENEADTTQDVVEDGSILSDTLTAFGDMLRNPFPGDVSPVKKATTKKATAATSNNDQTPETIVESTSSDNAKDDATSNDEDTTSKKDQKAADDDAATTLTTTTSKAPADLERIATSIGEEMSVDDIQISEKKSEEPTTAADDDAGAVNKASPADTTDNTANITTEEAEAKETNADNDNNDDDLLDITADLQHLETDATSRRVRDLLREAYGEHSFSADELDSKCQVLLERYAGREALLIAALEKKIRERKEAMEAVENAHNTALGELEGALTESAAGSSSAPARAASDEVKKVKTRKSKLGKAKSLVKKFPKFSPKKSKTAAAC